jgi:uncharacterized protein YidB (DUF937 family)
MDRWLRWRSRRIVGRTGARHLAVAAVAVLAATAGFAVLVSVLTGEAWSPVVVAIIGTLPALYLAFLAVPGVVSPPGRAAVFGRPVGWWNPVDLGVHKVIGGGPLPPYVLRPHDELLTAVLDPGVSASRLVVVRGGSSTGKTRAAWEALVRGQFADRQLDYPRDPAALKQRLDAGVPPRTVLWLGELRQYIEADGSAQVLGCLADLLNGEGCLLVTTMWPEHWHTYVAAAQLGQTAGPEATAGRLLRQPPELSGLDHAEIDPPRGGIIDVPAEFSSTELEAAASTNFPVLAEAAAAAASAGQGGRLTQYLAGVPALLDRHSGMGGDPYGQAVIIAAMDAARLGSADLLSAVFLLEAAVGYLTDAQRTLAIAAWGDSALDWACEELMGAVRAVQPVAPASGTGVAGYRVADWLDQHGRRSRRKEPGPASLWDALTTHTTATGDLARLGGAAWQLGLKRYAAALWTRAAAAGDGHATLGLLQCLRKTNPADYGRALRWAAVNSALDDPRAVSGLLSELVEAGADDALAALLARNPATHVVLDDLQGIGYLLEALRESGLADAVSVLAARAAVDAGLSHPEGVADLLAELRRAGANDAAAELAARAAAHADLDGPGGIAILVYALAYAEPPVDDAASVLADRAASGISFSRPDRVAELLDALAAIGADDAVDVLLSRGPASHISMNDAGAVAELLLALTRAGADDEAGALAARAAAHASLGHASYTAFLLSALANAGETESVNVLLSRRPAAKANLDYARGIAELLAALEKAGADDAVAELAARAAAHFRFDHPWDVTWLLEALIRADAGEAVEALLARKPATFVSLDDAGVPQIPAHLELPECS